MRRFCRNTHFSRPSTSWPDLSSTWRESDSSLDILTDVWQCHTLLLRHTPFARHRNATIHQKKKTYVQKTRLRSSGISPLSMQYRSFWYSKVYILMYNSHILVTDKEKSFLIKMFLAKYRCKRSHQGRSGSKLSLLVETSLSSRVTNYWRVSPFELRRERTFVNSEIMVPKKQFRSPEVSPTTREGNLLLRHLPVAQEMLLVHLLVPRESFCGSRKMFQSLPPVL